MSDTLEHVVGATRDATGEVRVLVNKRELAKRLDCSVPHIDTLIDRYPGLPIERRGSNGIEWQFDLVAVSAFIAEQRRLEAQQTIERDELLRQFTLPIDEAPDGTAGFSPTQRKANAEAIRIERKLAMETGLLLVTSHARQKLTPAIIQLGRMLDVLPTQMGRRFNLPPDVVRAMREMIEDARRDFVRDVGDLVNPGAERTDAAA